MDPANQEPDISHINNGYEPPPPILNRDPAPASPSTENNEARPKKEKTFLDRSRKPVSVFTFVIMLTAIAQAVITWYQWDSMRQQLREMKADNQDTADLLAATNRLATAAGKQADAAKSLAEQAKEQTTKMSAALEKTDDLILQATAQSEASGKLAQAAQDQVAKLDAGVTETHALAVAAANSAKAAADQTAISQLQLKNSQRPWVSFSEAIASPLTFDEAGAKITLDFILRNTGGSAATFVTFEPVFYVADGRKNDITERAALCNRLLQRGKFEETLFAGDTRRLNWTIPIPRADVEASAKMFNGMFVSHIVACVVYGSTLSGTPEYLTGTSTILTRTVFIENGNPSVVIRPTGTTKQEDLRLVADPVSGTIAR